MTAETLSSRGIFASEPRVDFDLGGVHLGVPSPCLGAQKIEGGGVAAGFGGGPGRRCRWPG